jgi:hypothetical protein
LSVPSKKSGGKRAVEKKHRVRAAARARAAIDGDPLKQWMREYEKLVGKPPLDKPDDLYLWTANALAFSADKAMRDEGLPLEQRRDQLTRIAPQLIKALEPAKLNSRISALEEEFEKQGAQRHAGSVADRTTPTT